MQNDITVCTVFRNNVLPR